MSLQAPLWGKLPGFQVVQLQPPCMLVSLVISSVLSSVNRLVLLYSSASSSVSMNSVCCSRVSSFERPFFYSSFFIVQLTSTSSVPLLPGAGCATPFFESACSVDHGSVVTLSLYPAVLTTPESSVVSESSVFYSRSGRVFSPRVTLLLRVSWPEFQTVWRYSPAFILCCPRDSVSKYFRSS